MTRATTTFVSWSRMVENEPPHPHTHHSLLSRACTFFFNTPRAFTSFFFFFFLNNDHVPSLITKKKKKKDNEESVSVCKSLCFSFASHRLFYFPLFSRKFRDRSRWIYHLPLLLDLFFQGITWSDFFPGKAVFSCSVLSLFDHVSTVARVC